MAEIKRVEGQPIVDYMARDFDSLLGAMREMIPYKLPEWTEHRSEADFGNVLLQLFAHMGDVLSYYQDRVANESFLATARTRRSVIHHLRLIGYRLATAAPASTELTLSFPAACMETVVLRRGDAFGTRSSKDTPAVRFEYSAETPRVIDCATLAVVGGRKVVAGIPVEEGRLVRDELLGTSDGTPGQRFELAHPRIVLRSLGGGRAVNRDIVLRTTLGGAAAEWTLLESLAFSGAGLEHFVVEVDEDDRATVVFGDGVLGAVPPAGAEVRATYRVGGGLQGNVAAGSVATIADAPQLSLLAVQVTNPRPATGGAERESIEEAVLHAPAVFRSLHRAVTRADYEALALEFSGVGKVRARAGSWNTVTLHVAPEGGGQVSDLLRANLLAYFEDLRPVSTLVEVEDVEYVEIFVAARVSVFGYYPRERVAEEVREAAGRLLAFASVDFDRPVYLSKFYEEIEKLPGVEFVTVTEFRRQGQAPGTVEPSGKIELRPFELPVGAAAYGGGVSVTATGGF